MSDEAPVAPAKRHARKFVKPEVERHEVRCFRRFLATRFPKCFVPEKEDKIPLKRAIVLDLDDRLTSEERPEGRIIRAFFDDYCNGLRYLKALKAGAARVDLDGNTVEIVTASAEADAKAKIQKQLAHIKEFHPDNYDQALAEFG